MNEGMNGSSHDGDFGLLLYLITAINFTLIAEEISGAKSSAVPVSVLIR